MIQIPGHRSAHQDAALPFSMRFSEITWRRAELLSTVILLLLPEVIAILYMIHNNHLPESDGAEYFLYGYRVYKHFRSGGVWDGLKALYWIRAWKPTAFPLFLTAALFVTSGRLYAALGTAVVVVTSYTTLYSFKLLKERLSPIASAIGAAFVTSVPVFLFLEIDFYSEITMPGLVVGVIYHLIRSKDFTETKHVLAAALLTALLLCIRPDQTLLTLGPVLIMAIGLGSHRNLLNGRDFGLCCIIPLLTVVILAAKVLCEAGAQPFPSGGVQGATAFIRLTRVALVATVTLISACAPLAWQRAHRLQSPAYAMLFFVLVACALPLVWFLPFSLSLFEWMYSCTFGDLARITSGGQVLGSFWSHTWALLRATGSFVILAAFAIATTGVSILRGNQLKVSFQGQGRQVLLYLLASVSATLALMLFGTSLTPAFWAGDPYRRLMGPFCVLTLTLLFIGLQSGAHARLRQGVAMLVLLTQFGALGLRSLGVSSWLAASPFIGGLLPPRLLLPEPNSKVIAELDGLARAEPVEAVSIEGYYDVSVGGVLLVAEAARAKYVIRRDVIVNYHGPPDVDDMSRRFSHVVFSMSPPTNGIREKASDAIRSFRNTQNPVFMRQADILDLIYTHELERHGLQFIRTMVLGQTEVYFLRSLAYAKTSPRVAVSSAAGPIMEDAGNLASITRGARSIATSYQPGFPISNLNDGTLAPWGSAEAGSDTFAGIVLSSAREVREFAITMFSPGQRQHLRDISIVTSDEERPGGPTWTVIGARIAGQGGFANKITIPQVADGAVIRIEVDTKDPGWRAHRIWGFACFSGSKGYQRNYLVQGTGIYVRELAMH